jgi:hypothetical protein
MCCIFCEEPVRSITVGLAAVGVVCLINGARKLLKSRSPGEASVTEYAERERCAPHEMESAS